MGDTCECGPGHTDHMCKLVKEGAPLEELKDLVADASYICSKCGRVAADEDRLCAPEPL